MQDSHFRQAVAEQRFVARIREPFVVICGFGNTGSLLAGGLSDASLAAVAIQSTSAMHEEAIATLGTDVPIVDPFQPYARYLGATIDNPQIYVPSRWLVSDPGANLDSVPRRAS